MTPDAVPADVERLIRRAYAAFSARDVGAVLATLHPDVDWPNVLDGTRLRGHAAVAAYWAGQFETTEPRVEPRGLALDGEGRVVVDVHQVVRSTDGAVLDDRRVRHAYTLRDGLVARMDVLPA